MYTDGDGYWPEWLKNTLAVAGVVLVVIAISALAVSTGGLAGVAIGAIAAGTGFGAAIGGYDAAKNGTSVSAGIIGGGIKGFASGAAVGLGILTGAGALTGMAALGAFATALGANFIGGMLSYTVKNSWNGNTPELVDACSCGVSQMIQGAISFGAGAILGISGFYNIPGQKGPFRTRAGNVIAGKFIRINTDYPINYGISQIGNFCG